MRSTLQQFSRDERAIEGLPVRLVIALVVGVASLGVMMNMLSGINGLAVSELDVRPSPEVTTPGHQLIELTVVDSDGAPIEDATVVIKRGTASLDGVKTGKTGSDGAVSLAAEPSLGPNQADGTLEVHIKPPPGSEFVDRRANTEILVVEG